MPASMVIVAEPFPGAAMAAGAKPTVAPAGKPVADSASEELKLPAIAVLIVDAPDPLCAIVSEDGDAEIEKSGGVPEVVVASAKSSTTNEVFRLEFSVPIK